MNVKFDSSFSKSTSLSAFLFERDITQQLCASRQRFTWLYISVHNRYMIVGPVGAANRLCHNRCAVLITTSPPTGASSLGAANKGKTLKIKLQSKKASHNPLFHCSLSNSQTQRYANCSSLFTKERNGWWSEWSDRSHLSLAAMRIQKAPFCHHILDLPFTVFTPGPIKLLISGEIARFVPNQRPLNQPISAAGNAELKG